VNLAEPCRAIYNDDYGYCQIGFKELTGHKAEGEISPNIMNLFGMKVWPMRIR
jgi:hypothetical protein